MRAHEQILVNGVVMQHGDRNARLIIKTPDARILRLRDAIHPEEADTPVKRVCYVAQLGVAGEADSAEVQRDLQSGIAQLAAAMTGLDGCHHLDEARSMLEDRNYYGVLRALRRLLPLEERLLRGSGSPMTVQ